MRVAPSIVSRRWEAPLRAGSRSASQWAGARWSNIVRAASKEVTPDDPPSKPLPETHELGGGESDFSNWVDSGRDVSLPQALGGFGFMVGVCFAIYNHSTTLSKNSTPVFKKREFPGMAADIPTWAEADARP